MYKTSEEMDKAYLTLALPKIDRKNRYNNLGRGSSTTSAKLLVRQFRRRFRFDLDRSLYNPSMITRLLQAVTHFADNGSRAFHETRPSFNYISYTYPRDPGRGHLSVEDIASVVDERFPRETRL